LIVCIAVLQNTCVKRHDSSKVLMRRNESLRGKAD
jgi:hypothetical protein